MAPSAAEASATPGCEEEKRWGEVEDDLTAGPTRQGHEGEGVNKNRGIKVISHGQSTLARCCGSPRQRKWRMCCFVRLTVAKTYSRRFGKGRRLVQRHGLQSATLTSYFYKNNY
jgi:hypothetical protein